MGQSSSSSSSSSRRRRDEYPPYPLPPPFQDSSSYPTPPPPPPPTTSASGFTQPAPPSYTMPPYPSSSSRPNYNTPYPAPAPPPPHSYSQQSTAGYANHPRFLDPLLGRYRYAPNYGAHQGSGWWTSSPAASSPWMPVAPRPPPPFVEHQKAKTVKNDVNVHKDTIRLEPDGQDPDQLLVSFTFDALVDGSVTIFYFAKEGANCTFSPLYPDMCKPTEVPFQKGIAQKFHQPSGTGIDLGFFEIDDLIKPLNGDIFPLVIYAGAGPPPLVTGEEVDQFTSAVRAQITQAVIEKNNNGSFVVKVMQQILWIDGERYELQEIFGLESSAEPEIGNVDEDMGKDCVICLSEPRDTVVYPCRHLCMCSECAKALRLQSNKCPICRQPIEKLMEIKVESADH